MKTTTEFKMYKFTQDYGTYKRETIFSTIDDTDAFRVISTYDKSIPWVLYKRIPERDLLLGSTGSWEEIVSGGSDA